MVAITTVPVLRVRCGAHWDVSGSMVGRDSNLGAQLLPALDTISVNHGL